MLDEFRTVVAERRRFQPLAGMRIARNAQALDARPNHVEIEQDEPSFVGIGAEKQFIELAGNGGVRKESLLRARFGVDRLRCESSACPFMDGGEPVSEPVSVSTSTHPSVSVLSAMPGQIATEAGDDGRRRSGMSRQSGAPRSRASPRRRPL